MPRQHLRDAGGVFGFADRKWRQTSMAANGTDAEEDTLPLSALLGRIRRLVPKSRDQHYDEIVRNFGVGALRPPPTPMRLAGAGHRRVPQGAAVERVRCDPRPAAGPLLSAVSGLVSGEHGTKVSRAR